MSMFKYRVINNAKENIAGEHYIEHMWKYLEYKKKTMYNETTINYYERFNKEIESVLLTEYYLFKINYITNY